MECITKPKVSAEQLAAIATTHLGANSVSTRELTDGWFNAAYMLAQPDGTEYVLKVAPSPDARVMRYEENILEVEVETMRRVAAVTDLPIPKIVAYDRTCTLVDSEFFLMEKLPGAPFNHVRDAMAPEDQGQIYRQVGAHLRSLHEIKNETYGLYNRPVFANWADAFRGLYEDLRRDGADLEVPLPDGAFEAGERFFPALEVVNAASMVHWDLWEGNIFVDAGRVTGIIDFERTLWGDPLMEVNFWGPRDGLIEGYGTNLLEEPLATERRMLYDLYFYLVMVIESKFRGFTPEHEAWPRGMLDELLTRIRLLS